MNQGQNTAQNLPPMENTNNFAPVLDLKYFYGDEVLNTTFFMTPKLLFRNKELSDLSSDAKILYMFLLDRLKLSAKNGLKDNDGRLFVFYTIEEACYELHKTNKTTGKAFSQLELIGLIEKTKRGQGKADKIYVKSVASVPADYPTFREYKKANGEPLSHGTYEYLNDKTTQYSQKLEIIPIPTGETNPQSHLYEAKIPENCSQLAQNNVENFADFCAMNVDNSQSKKNVHFQNGTYSNPRSVEIPVPEMEKVHGNNNKLTNTEKNNTDVLKPTLPPNPTPTFPQFHNSPEFLEQWGEGWREMTADRKSFVIAREMESAFQEGKEELQYLMFNYRTDSETMSLVLDYLMNMEELDSINQDNEELSKEHFRYKATKLYKQALLDMLTEEKYTKTKHGYINYGKVIEKVLEHLIYDKYSYSVKLDNIVFCTVWEYMDAAAETKINHKLNYMKTCIWSTFLTGNIHDEQQYHKFATDCNFIGYERNYHGNEG